MLKITNLFIFSFALYAGSPLYAADTSVSTSLPTPRPANVTEAFTRFEKQLEEIDRQQKTFLTIANKERRYKDDLMIKEEPGYVWDIDIGVHSSAFTEIHKSPNYLVMDLPEGVGRLGYSQVTHGRKVECLFKLLLDKKVFPNPGAENMMNPSLYDGFTTPAYNLKGPSQYGGSVMIASISIGSLQDFDPQKKKISRFQRLRLYSTDMFEKYDYYVLGNFCDSSLAKLFAAGDVAIFFRKKPAPESLADYQVIEIPDAFGKIISEFARRIKIKSY